MARAPKKSQRPHWLTIVALACIVLFGVTVVGTNVVGWPKLIPGPLGYIFAILALCAGGFAFSLWEHVRLFFKERRWWNFAGALLFFIGALAIDGVGVHSGIETLAQPWMEQMEADAGENMVRRQRALDDRRADLEREIAGIRADIAAVAPADMTGGPQNDAQERARWNDQTAGDRARLTTKQTQLDNMARTVAAEPVAPWLTYAIWAFALFAECVVAFGVSMLGIEIAPQFVKGREQARPPAPPQPQPATPAPSVRSIDQPRQKRQAAARDGSRWSGSMERWH